MYALIPNMYRTDVVDRPERKTKLSYYTPCKNNNVQGNIPHVTEDSEPNREYKCT